MDAFWHCFIVVLHIVHVAASYINSFFFKKEKKEKKKKSIFIFYDVYEFLNYFTSTIAVNLMESIFTILIVN